MSDLLPPLYAVRRIAGDRWLISAPDDDPRTAAWRAVAIVSAASQTPLPSSLPPCYLLICENFFAFCERCGQYPAPVISCC
jgi:hypothetical protein